MADLPWQNEKQRRIFECLSSNPVAIETLRDLAVSHGGLVHSSIRRKAWTKLVGIDVFRMEQYSGSPLSQHKDRAQVLLDVNRCGKRIPQRKTRLSNFISYFHNLDVDAWSFLSYVTFLLGIWGSLLMRNNMYNLSELFCSTYRLVPRPIQ